MSFTQEDGAALLRFVRQNITHYLQNDRHLPFPQEFKEKFGEKYGIFVTLMKEKGSELVLRGCIGYDKPLFPLYKAISDVSISAAVEDPRFPRVDLDELNRIRMEVSILTTPKIIDVKSPDDYLEKIKIGRDGLIVKKNVRQGLLLPQVPVEQGRNWDVKTFLEHTCLKAHLPRDAWKDPSVQILSFQAIIFEETSPGGLVVETALGGR
ncbi:MAG: ammecr1 domain-containing protein [Promethearchaeota archaeon CR_4]|nr:MAG: ammecr1 domain-containing protein [Candidatus Lokiarchaeota archaeon CR_4]